MSDSIFTKIINGDIPCYKILENEHFVSFLDINPIKEGHTLVVPKLQVDYIYDLPNDIFAGLFNFSKIVAQKLKSSIECDRIGISVVGLEVPHAHIHLIPINEISDMSFEKPRIHPSKIELDKVLKKIKNSK
jgi:histidine triad (HIT) family protein|tara:strand:- start:3332 stop:3727 length:396 start_codon:yes stop_codon:yes gene_type:complete